MLQEKIMTLPELVKAKKYKAMKPPHYLDVYEQYWARMRYGKIKLMEVGIAEGGSLKLWRDYFPNGEIYGMDGKRSTVKGFGKRITTFYANQNSVGAMSKIASAAGPFDVVIDDGAHTGRMSLNTFLAFFPAVVPGGLYVIEDWGTGYWEHWPDGAKVANDGNFTFVGKEFPSHQSGMVGLVKQLVDVCNTLDRTMGGECSQINSMEIMPGMVLLRKRTSAIDLQKRLTEDWYKGKKV